MVKVYYNKHIRLKKGVKIMSSSWFVAYLLFIVGFLIIGYTAKRSILKKRKNKKSEAYWAREHAATFSRRTEIPADLFIAIDFSVYPMIADEKCQQLYDKILRFKERPLINLKDYSNITLKENFGTMQLEKLANYEQNFMDYMNTSYNYGQLLFDKAYLPESQKVFEYILSIGCDLSKVYLTLTEVYVTLYTHNPKKALDYLEQLKQTAMHNMANSPYLPKVIKVIDSQINQILESEML